MNAAFRILLTVNATSLLVIIYLVQKGYTLDILFKDVPWLSCISTFPDIASYFLYLLIPVLSTRLSIFLSRYLGKDDFKSGDIVSVEHANNSFLPSYLGYFFVALSINDADTLCFVYLVLFVFTFLSQALYFNPLFLLFGYEFYNVKTKSGAVLFLISKEKYKAPSEVLIPVAYRINNYTFIERA